MVLFIDVIPVSLLVNGLILLAGAVLLYLIWDPIPNKLGWPFFRGRDGFAYFVWRGTQTGDGTRGRFLRVILNFDGYKIDEQTGDIVPCDCGGDRSILGLGIFWIGFLCRVERMRNKWSELVNGKIVNRVVDEYGFSVKDNLIATEIKEVEDISNIPFDLVLTFYWAIINPIKAKRLRQDTHIIVLEKLMGSLVAWFKQEAVYHPQDDGGGIKLDIDQIRDRFWEYLQKLRDLSLDQVKALGIRDRIGEDMWIARDDRKIYIQISLLQEIEWVYGYRVKDLAISSINPGSGFAEALSASVKARLEGAADLIRAQFRKLGELEDLEAALLWGQVAEAVKGTALGQMAQSFREHGVPPFFDASALEKWFEAVIPDAEKGDLKKTVDKLMEDINKAREKTKI